MTLEAAASSKAEQQFGDSVIPEVLPDWRSVESQALALMRRTKDVRVAVLALRAATRIDGVSGFVLGLQALLGLLERYWESIHPQLDADEDFGPTMRLNALAPLTNGDMLLRDLHEARLGTSRSLGQVLVRDVEQAFGKLAPREGEAAHSVPQIEGALTEIFADQAGVKDACMVAVERVAQLQAALNARLGSAHSVDFRTLRDIAAVVQHAARGLGASGQDDSVDNATATAGSPGQSDAAPARSANRGEITTRQEAVKALDKVILYLEQTEPGNPAPLLIKRAQRLIGVSFLDIMSDLAPDALSTIENITGRSS
jgi:type VI secretion system protein ImpA